MCDDKSIDVEVIDHVFYLGCQHGKLMRDNEDLASKAGRVDEFEVVTAELKSQAQRMVNYFKEYCDLSDQACTELLDKNNLYLLKHHISKETERAEDGTG